MALLFIDGFDHYATADIIKKWTAINGSVAINASGGRRGGGSLEAGNSNRYARKTVTAGASFIIGFALSFTAIPTGAVPICQLYDSGTLQCDIRLNSDGTLSVTRNGTALTSGTSGSALTTGAFYYIEWKVTISDSISANSCKVRVNNTDWVTVATGQDTKNTANASANEIRLGNLHASISAGTMEFDDFYYCDSSGSVNNDFLGDCRIDTLYPTSDGNYSQFTPSTGTTHYTLVDETAPNTTDYNSSATLNQIDSYGMGDLPTSPSTVYGVQVSIAALKSDAGARSITPLVRSSTTDGLGTAFALSTSQLYALSIYETNPNGSVAWTATSVNAAEVGVKVTT